MYTSLKSLICTAPAAESPLLPASTCSTGGTGSITINGRDIDEYFGLDTLKMVVRQPLEATGHRGQGGHRPPQFPAAAFPVRPAPCATALPAPC